MSAELPAGLERERHLDRPQHSPWPRRAAVILMAAFCALGLANVFGQVASVSSADSAAARLDVDSPLHLRGGVIYTSAFTIRAHRPISDARLLLAPGWFGGVTFNGIAPQAQQELADARGVQYDYGQVGAGESLPIWMSWQMNPTTVGGRDQDVALYDGDRLLAAVHRTVVVYP